MDSLNEFTGIRFSWGEFINYGVDVREQIRNRKRNIKRVYRTVLINEWL